MKKRLIVLICIGVFIVLFIVGVILVAEFTYYAKYHIWGKVESVKISSTLDGNRGPMVVSEKDKIDVLLKCIKKVRVNNRHIRMIQIAPIQYEITFYFANGKTKTYDYTVYPATKCDSPFEDFFALFPEEERR